MLTTGLTFVLFLLLTLLLFHTAGGRMGNGAVETFSSVGDTTSTVFVSVASYRDDECSRTLEDMFDKADNPRRVFAGVCQQNKVGDVAEQCLKSELLGRNRGNIRIVSLDHTQARGPTYARYICSTLARGEDVFMQIDSHTRFVKGWDTLVIEMLRRCPTQPAVLTHYAPEMGARTSSWDENALVPVLCDASFNEDDIPVFKARLKQPVKGYFKLIPFVSGNFWAARGSVLNEVPFDPDLPQLFQGEELLHSVRLWTAGYDLYVPTRNLVMHEYGRREKPKYWDDITNYRTIQKETLRKVRYMLGISKEAPMQVIPQMYGLGTKRTLSEYWEFAGIEPLSKSVKSADKFCAA